MNKRRLGDMEEISAIAFLQNNGYKIVERNFRCKLGEIDIVAENDGYLVFLEVKYRSGLQYGNPAEAIGFKKQQTIYKVAQYYLMKHKVGDMTPVRFDAVIVVGDEISVIKNAFGGM